MKKIIFVLFICTMLLLSSCTNVVNGTGGKVTLSVYGY